MLKVLFILENLNGGGAERVLPNLLKYINHDKYNVSLLTLFEDGINRGRIPEGISVYSRQAPYFKGITYAVKFCTASSLYRYFVKRAIPDDDFDIVVAYTNGLATKIVSGAGKHSLAWIHGDFLGIRKPNFPRNFISRKSMLEAIGRIDAIVGVSKQVCDSFTKYTGISERVHLIHNTNDVEEIERKADAENPYSGNSSAVNIVTVGHLQKVKGNDLLLGAMAILKKDGLDFHVTILGEGKERGGLEEYARNNDLSEYVSMPGHIDNPYPYIKHADIYVCPSRSEGFSTAVSEAIILGCPVISTRVSGAEEILGEHNEFGIVCDISVEGLYDALRKMLQDAPLRQHYARQAKIRSSMFEPYKCAGEVERLFDELIEKR